MRLCTQWSSAPAFAKVSVDTRYVMLMIVSNPLRLATSAINKSINRKLTIIYQ
jgi:hypothetical protein